MSGHWRFGVAACLFVAGFSTLPASSNPLTDLFNPAPREAAAPAPAPAKEVCVPRPGNATAAGQHWFYRVDGHRKCWFQAAEATHSVSKPARHYVARRPARQPAMAPEENEADERNKTVMDARAQLLSSATVDTSQSTAAAPKAIDGASVPDDEAAASAPAAPVAVQPTIDRLAPNRAAPRSVDVEMLLADSSLDKEAAVSSASPAVAGAALIADPDRTTTRAGVVLIALGLFFLIGSLLASRFLGSRLVPVRRS
jgi:hypothetical protein